MAAKDQVLIKRVLAGDSTAFGDLVERYARLVRGVLWETLRQPDEVEDLVQEVFCKAYEQLATLRQPDKFASWLWQIANNAVLFHQRQQRKLAKSVHHHESRPLYLRRPDEVVEDQETASLVWGALDQLDPECRRLVILHYFEGCGQREIACFLGLSLATVKWRLFKAKGTLRDELLSRLGGEFQESTHGRRYLRGKVMAFLPVTAFFHPPPRRWLDRWVQWKYWALGAATTLGIGGLIFQAFRQPVGQPSREALRLEQQARLYSDPSLDWDPNQVRAGQRVRITAADLQVKQGDQAELHYLKDLYSLIDHTVPMHREGDLWVCDLEVPKDAEAVFLFVTPRQEGPQPLQYRAYLATQVAMRRYRQSLVVLDEAGQPVRNAARIQSLMAQIQERPVEEMLACVDRELALYPDNFPAYRNRWGALLRNAGLRAAAVMSQVRREQAQLRARYPDRPEVLWEAAQVLSDQQDTLYQELYQRFPDHEQADEAAFLRANDLRSEQDPTRALAAFEDFFRRFPKSRYAGKAYRYYLIALAPVAPDRAARVADSLIYRTLVVPYDPAQEGTQSFPTNTSAGCLPEGFAYSLRFDLLLKKGRAEEAEALARHLIASALRDPQPYLYIGQKLAGQQSRALLSEKPPLYPLDLSLAAQVLESGLSQAVPENMLELPGSNSSFLAHTSAAEEQRKLNLDKVYFCRQAFLQSLAECYMARGDYAQAIHYLEEFAALEGQYYRRIEFPKEFQTFALLGESYEQLGKWEEAESAYLEAVAQNYSDPRTEAALRRLHQERYGTLEKLPPLLQACHPPAPAFSLKDSLGQEVRLTEYRGKILLLYYDYFGDPEPVAGQSPQVSKMLKPSLSRQTAQLKEWEDRFHPQGLEVLYVSRLPMSAGSYFRLALDDVGLMDQYQLRGSSIVLIDREGRLRLRQWRRFDVAQEEPQNLQVVDKIEELLQETHSGLVASGG